MEKSSRWARWRTTEVHGHIVTGWHVRIDSDLASSDFCFISYEWHISSTLGWETFLVCVVLEPQAFRFILITCFDVHTRKYLKFSLGHSLWIAEWHVKEMLNSWLWAVVSHRWNMSTSQYFMWVYSLRYVNQYVALGLWIRMSLY